MVGKKFVKAISRRGPLRVLKRYVIWTQHSLRFSGRGFLWPLLHTEDSNFYYPLTQDGEIELAQFVSVACDVSPEQVLNLFQELRHDEEVRGLLEDFRNTNSLMRDATFDFGRRLGWYAIVRIRRPRVVVETGVHNGLGGAVILAALRKNETEGYPGTYIGTDLNPKAGSLFRGSSLEKLGSVRFGDSIESIRSISGEIDLAITDSNHTDGYEALELLQIESILSPGGWVISDNAHATNVLQEWSLERGRHYLLYREQTTHWSQGAGLGLSWPR